MQHLRKDYTERFGQDSLSASKGGIPKDEPVFLLRAQDRLSADTIDFWCDALESNGGNLEMIEEVREFANMMRSWPKRKLPDTPLDQLRPIETFGPGRTEDTLFVDLGPPVVDGDPLEGAE